MIGALRVKTKRRGKLSKGLLFHQDNAPAHRSVITMAAINDCDFELIQHPPYSSDLAPSDFHLFPKLKKAISGTHFQVIHTVEDFLDSQENDFLKVALQHRWQKCIYIEGIVLKNNTICLSKVKTLHVRLTIFQSALIYYYLYNKLLK